MIHRKAWAAAVVALALALVLSGCAAEEDASSGEADLPPQDGLEVGETAPDFRLKNQAQETVALSDYRGEKNVILVFYPLAFTPV